MQFISESFRCDVDVYNSSDSVAIRFYHKFGEQKETEIVDMVEVKPPLGYLSLKFIGDSGDGLMSGYLAKDVFTESMVRDAVDFLEDLTDRELGYIPHHITLVTEFGFVEYNGET